MVLRGIAVLVVALLPMGALMLSADEGAPVRPQTDYAVGEMRLQTLTGFEYLYPSKEITHDQIPQAIGELVGKAMGAMKEAGITPSGLPTASVVSIYRNAMTVGEPFTLEAGFIVPPGRKPAGEAKVKTIPPWRCATVVYSGGIPHPIEAITKLG